MQEWQNVEQEYLYASKELDPPVSGGSTPHKCGAGYARINNTSKNIWGWVNMQEWWVNMNRNGGSTWSGIYNLMEMLWSK
ncbi:MAG: hypothetical protein H0U27_07540 [Nitrosopumilus sp.]|nr:hypothetical protein [Nitrosopumilus sp.]